MLHAVSPQLKENVYFCIRLYTGRRDWRSTCSNLSAFDVTAGMEGGC